MRIQTFVLKGFDHLLFYASVACCATCFAFLRYLETDLKAPGLENLNPIVPLHLGYAAPCRAESMPRKPGCCESSSMRAAMLAQP